MKKKCPIPSTVEVSLESDDIEESLGHQKGLWLGRFAPEEVSDHLRDFGITQHLAKRGFKELSTNLECEPFRYTLRITGVKNGPQLLVEVKARRTSESLIGQLGSRAYSVLVLDWLLFQDPSAQFDSEHPRLPGQEHPGLNLLELGTRLLMAEAEELDVDLVLTYPRHFHNAVFYATQFRFLEPITEGHFRALRRDLSSLDLATASAALEESKVIDAEGRPVHWIQKAQAWPHSKDIEKELFGEAYEHTVARASEQTFRYSAT